MQHNEITTGSETEEIEIEMVIRGPPPPWCSCVCQEYMRDPCLVCRMREILSSDQARLSPEGELYLIPRSEIDRLLREKRREG